MPTIFSHGMAAIALGNCYPAQRMPVRFWVLAALCAALPDADVVGFGLGIHYYDLLGHRGLTHSLFFALAVAFLVVLLGFRNIKAFSVGWWGMIACFFAFTASHGVLDAMTDGGLGVAFFSPFTNTRYFFPWRPIAVSPLSLEAFLSSGVIVSEVFWVWIPSALLVLAAYSFRRMFRPSR